jgi:hypothetical protein
MSMQFSGRITGVQLTETSIPSTVTLAGHLEDVGCTITIYVNRETAKAIEHAYGLDDEQVPIQLGNGGKL